MRWNNWALLGSGLWLIVSPWLLGYWSYNLVTWNSILLGTVVVVMTLWNVTQ